MHLFVCTIATSYSKAMRLLWIAAAASRTKLVMVVIGDDNYDGHNEHNMVVMRITMTEHGYDEMVVVVMMMVWMPLLLMVLAVVKTIMPQSVVTMVISSNNNSSNSNRSSISSDSSNTKTISAAPHSRRTRPIPVLMTVLGRLSGW